MIQVSESHNQKSVLNHNWMIAIGTFDLIRQLNLNSENHAIMIRFHQACMFAYKAQNGKKSRLQVSICCFFFTNSKMSFLVRHFGYIFKSILYMAREKRRLQRQLLGKLINSQKKRSSLIQLVGYMVLDYRKRPRCLELHSSLFQQQLKMKKH